MKIQILEKDVIPCRWAVRETVSFFTDCHGQAGMPASQPGSLASIYLCREEGKAGSDLEDGFAVIIQQSGDANGRGVICWSPACDEARKTVPFEGDSTLIECLLGVLFHFLRPGSTTENLLLIEEAPAGAGGAVNVFQQKRLEIQARATHAIDMALLRPVVERLREAFPGERLRVLDVGCGYGDVVVQRFSDMEDCDVCGVDQSAESIALANGRFKGSRFQFVEGDARFFTPEKPPHLILMFQFLQHVPEPVPVAQRYWELLLPGGYLFARNSDDALNVTHPPNEALDALLRETDLIPHSPDRHIGRKLFSIMSALSPASKRINPDFQPQFTAGADLEGRMAFFAEMHSFRNLYAAREFKKRPSLGAAIKLICFRAWTQASMEHFIASENLFSAEIQCYCSAAKP